MFDAGKRVTELRESQGLKITALANLSGIAQSSLSYIESGKNNPTIDTVSKICDAPSKIQHTLIHSSSTGAASILAGCVRPQQHPQKHQHIIHIEPARADIPVQRFSDYYKNNHHNKPCHIITGVSLRRYGNIFLHNHQRPGQK